MSFAGLMSHKLSCKSQFKAKPVKTGSKKVAADKENINQTETSSLADDEVKSPRVIVPWGKEDYFHKTDALLSLIEDSPTWQAAFGFDLGGLKNPTPTGKGKSLIQHCADIAIAFFITGEKESTWTTKDIKLLRGSNDIHSLKSTYHAFKELLGETGHGLVVAGSASELYQGSEATNAWENIEKKFPWYCHMAALIGGNPNYSRKAISNSQSALDLSVLDHAVDEEENGDPCTPVPFDDEEEEDIPDPSLPLQEFTLDDSKEKCREGQHRVQEKFKLTIPSKRLSDVSSVSQSAKKRKTPQDLIKEVAHAEREVRVSMNEINAREKTARERIKRKVAHDTAVELETMRLRVQREEAAAQRAHELAMMDKQIQLALLQQGRQVGTLGVIDPQLRG
ncbi:hypothetical protein EDD15DRAFT_2363296 [Pisolithus albus]|nr:hypothetical protein EDD15DRAFT_2363296 [Pisolithus albus]